MPDPYLDSVLEAIARDALDGDGPRLISAEELRAAGALDVPPSWRNSLSIERETQPGLFDDLDDPSDDEDQDGIGPYADNHIGMTTPKGPMATVGMDLNFTPHLFGRVDARYMHGGSDIAVDGAKVGDADLNPVVLGVGVGARF